MKLRKLARQLAAAAVAGAMALSLCMPALAETWDFSNQPDMANVSSVYVAASSGGRTVELNHGASTHKETKETVLSGSGAASISLGGTVRR